MRFIQRELVKAPAILSSDAVFREKVRMNEFFEEASSKKQRRYLFNSKLYANQEIRMALVQLFNGKCAYCETVIYGDFAIEHFRPKTGAMNLDGNVHKDHYWWLAFEWENLYSCCNHCNRYKRTRFPVQGRRAKKLLDSETQKYILDEKYLLLDPCNIDDFSGAPFRMTNEGVYIGQTKPGETTIEVLNLNRDSLVLGRKKVKDVVEKHMRSAKNLTKVDELYTYLQNSLMDTINVNAPYLSISQYYIGYHINKPGKVKNKAIFKQFADELVQGKPHQPDQIAISENLKSKQEPQYKFSQDYSMNLETKSDKEAYFSSSKSIESVEISNFKIIKHLKLNFPKSEPTEEAWMVLLGENGAGKSSVLQAIALTLAGENKANGIGLDASKFVNRNVKTNKGFVKIYLNGVEEPLELHFNKESPLFSSPNEESKVILLGFGSTRLMANDHNEFKANNLTNLHNLFDPFASLPNIEDWVNDPAKVNVRTFDQIAIELKKLLQLPADKLIYRRKSRKGNHQLFIKIQSDKHGIKLRELSSGYQAIIVMTLNIMKELLNTWDSIAIAEGIVLIDEIGVHLHPKWKMKIISTLREIFPALTFIITTHEPLCLRGVNQGEVVLMKFDENQEVIGLTELPSPNGLTVEQLITSKFFGLITSFDPEIETQLNSFYLLKSKLDPTPDELLELEKLEIELERINIIDEDSNLDVGNSQQFKIESDSLDAGWVSNPVRQDELKSKIKTMWENKKF